MGISRLFDFSVPGLHHFWDASSLCLEGNYEAEAIKVSKNPPQPWRAIKNLAAPDSQNILAEVLFIFIQFWYFALD